MNRLEVCLKDIKCNIEQVVVDKEEVIRLIILALICKGHVLIEDVPGVGKTTLAQALAKSIAGSFRRIQFTPDVLPSDIIGFSMYNPKKDIFEYKEGAIMSQFVLADEINRTSPKTQSSLLQVMEDGSLTVDGQLYEMPKPFMILATQNPVEYVGTFPLPEAQMDRFFMKISIGYPSPECEKKMLSRFQKSNPLHKVQAVATSEEIIKLQEEVALVYVDESIHQLIIDLIHQTRKHKDVTLGVSPRGAIALNRSAQGRAYLEGRNYVIPEDIVKMAPFVLSHRLQLSYEAKLKEVKQKDIILEIIKHLKMPKVKNNVKK